MEEELPSLEVIESELEAEKAEWNRRGLGLGQVNFGEIGVVIFDMSVRLQALTNVLILNDVFKEEEINYQYKYIMLNNLRALREAAPQQQADALRRRILEGIHMPRPNGKPPWEA